MFMKAPAQPLVGLSPASEFNETVAMDLRQYGDGIIIHLIDVCTKFSSATFVSNKKPSTIVNAIVKIWISVYGTPIKFLSDNGEEFANA